MKGFITDSELHLADTEFPGIAAFFDSLLEKPGTFLELVGRFEHWGEGRLGPLSAPYGTDASQSAPRPAK
jgi:hypothetical protein